MSQVQAFGVAGGVVDLAYVDGSDQGRRERNLLQQPTIYAATGDSNLQTYTVAEDGTLSPGSVVPMPGQVSRLAGQFQQLDRFGTDIHADIPRLVRRRGWPGGWRLRYCSGKRGELASERSSWRGHRRSFPGAARGALARGK